jgi:5,10-methylenetetrahydromethanopterin reductase
LKLAISFGHGPSPSEIVLGAKKCEEFGLDLVWVSESTGFDAFSLLGSIAVSTSRIGLGSGIVNIYSRTPAQLAMAAATISSLSSGRFTLGLGVSSKQVIENWHGMQYSNQLKRVREVIPAIRNKLEQELASLGSNASLEKSSKVPIVLACVMNRMTRLSKELANGALFFMRPLRNLRTEIPKLTVDGPFQVFANVPACISSEPLKAKERVQRTVAFYLAFGDAYRSLIKREFPHLSDQTEQIKSLWLKGNRTNAARLVPEEILEEVALHGTVSDVNRKIENDYRKLNGLSALGLRFDQGEATFTDSLRHLSKLVVAP